MMPTKTFEEQKADFFASCDIGDLGLSDEELRAVFAQRETSSTTPVLNASKPSPGTTPKKHPPVTKTPSPPQQSDKHTKTVPAPLPLESRIAAARAVVRQLPDLSRAEINDMLEHSGVGRLADHEWRDYAAQKLATQVTENLATKMPDSEGVRQELLYLEKELSLYQWSRSSGAVRPDTFIPQLESLSPDQLHDFFAAYQDTGYQKYGLRPRAPIEKIAQCLRDGMRVQDIWHQSLPYGYNADIEEMRASHGYHEDDSGGW